MLVSCEIFTAFIWRKSSTFDQALFVLIDNALLALIYSKACAAMTKSSTCFSKRSGAPLTEYASLEDANEGAQFANKPMVATLCPIVVEVAIYGTYHQKIDKQQPRALMNATALEATAILRRHISPIWRCRASGWDSSRRNWRKTQGLRVLGFQALSFNKSRQWRL